MTRTGECKRHSVWSEWMRVMQRTIVTRLHQRIKKQFVIQFDGEWLQFSRLVIEK